MHPNETDSQTPTFSQRPTNDAPTYKEKLDEASYVKCLSAIIKRDFFPDLPLLDAQYDYLTAVERQDLQAMESAKQAIEKYAIEKDSAAATYSLDEFVTAYTSEDNASFARILARINRERKRRYKWVYDKEKACNALHSAALPMPTLALKTEECKESASSAAAPLHREDGVLMWKYAGKNSLMFVPDAAQNVLPEYEAANTKSNNIAHAKTRLLTATLNAAATPSSSLGSAQEASPKASSAKQAAYAYVPATPLLVPSAANAGLTMTWGTIASTPAAVECTPAAAAAVYAIPKTPRRETLAHALAARSIGASGRIAKAHTPRTAVSAATPHYHRSSRSLNDAIKLARKCQNSQ